MIDISTIKDNLNVMLRLYCLNVPDLSGLYVSFFKGGISKIVIYDKNSDYWRW